MDAPSSSSPLPITANDSTAAAEAPPPPLLKGVGINGLRTINNKKKNKVFKDASAIPPSSSSSSALSSTRVAYKRRHPKVVFAPVWRGLRGSGRGGLGNGHMEAIALPLGMSFAAVVAQVLERKDIAGDRFSVDHLSMICTSAVNESLAIVFGDKFEFFARNFEKSFRSTLRTLRLINEVSINKEALHVGHVNGENCASDATLNKKIGCSSNLDIKNCLPMSDLRNHKLINDSSINEVACHLSQLNLEGSAADLALKKMVGCTSGCGISDGLSETNSPTTSVQNQMHIQEEIEENVSTDCPNRELALHGHVNQLARASSSLGSVVNHIRTLEKFVMEQTRSNDLKTLEIGIEMKKLKLKEEQLAVSFDSNRLERSKLAMGISKASFKAEKFKTQLEETRNAELLKKCVDCLVAGLLIMSASLSYSAYVFSYRRITEATASCTPPEESKSWWTPQPFSSFNSGFHTLRCQFQVWSRMFFGFAMILAVAYLLFRRSGTSQQAMPVTFLLLLLGAFCGFAGKFCVDTLGGSGFQWLLYWETLCLVHFFSTVCTSTLFHLLYGPVAISQETKHKARLPYSYRQFLFYATLLVFVPLCCGLLPFASPGEWKNHFLQLATNFLSTDD